MAVIAVDPSAVWEVSLADDTGDEKTIFQLGLVDGALRDAIDDESLLYTVNRGAGPNGQSTATMNRKARARRIVRFGLRGWRSFRDGSGADVRFEREDIVVPGVGTRKGVTDACLERLDPAWILELADRIVEGNHISPDEKKS